MVAPDELLGRFLTECAQELNECTIDSYQPLSEIRQHLLLQQRSCLERVVEKWNSEKNDDTPANVTGDDVQAQLRDLQHQSSPSSSTPASQQHQHQHQHQQALEDKLQTMNEAARLAFCRLVLYSELLLEANTEQKRQRDSSLSSSGPMKRADILEFCGLCQTAVRLPNVERHLRDGSPLFDHRKEAASDESSSSTTTAASSTTETTRTIFPQKRLEAIQRRYLSALGYDPDHGTAEIKRIFFTPKPNEYSDDTVLIETFNTLVNTMNATLTNATLFAQQAMLSDATTGTRVVSVQYSEKIIDASSGEEIATSTNSPDAVPLGERMEQHQLDDEDSAQRENFKIAQQAAALQQEILCELLSLRDEEREAKLTRAKEVVEEFGRKAMEIPPGAERVAFLRSVDNETQRLMVMHKLWQSMIESNGGKEPTIHHHHHPNE